MPSVQKIVEAFGLTESEAKKVRQIMSSSENIEDKLKKIGVFIQAHGVEAAGKCHITKGPPLLYCNMGDTYDVTVCYFRGRFIVGDWGTIVERHPKLFPS